MGERWRRLLAAIAGIALLATAGPVDAADGAEREPLAAAVALGPLAALDPDDWSAARPVLDLGPAPELEAPGRDPRPRAEGGRKSGLLDGVRPGTTPSQRWLDLPLAPVFSRLVGSRPVLTPLSLYLSGGAAPTHGGRAPDAGENGFAYRAGAGLAYELTPGVTLSAGWRYDYVEERPPPYGPGSGLPFDERAIASEGHHFVGGLRIDYGVAPLDAWLARP